MNVLIDPFFIAVRLLANRMSLALFFQRVKRAFGVK
jgi:hypothetical protein